MSEREIFLEGLIYRLENTMFMLCAHLLVRGSITQEQFDTLLAARLSNVEDYVPLIDVPFVEDDF